MKREKVVYEHWRPDLNVCFYVGMGTPGRAKAKRRNPHHANIVKKLKSLGLSIDVRLISENLTKEEAVALEIERIRFWRHQGVALVNLTAGGDGVWEPSDETREKMSINNGMKRPEVVAKVTAKVREAMSRPEVKAKFSGDNNPMRRPEIAAKVMGSLNSPENLLERSARMKAVMQDPVKKAERREGLELFLANPENRSKLASFAGRKHTPETKAKMSERRKLKWATPGYREAHSGENSYQAKAKSKQS